MSIVRNTSKMIKALLFAVVMALAMFGSSLAQDPACLEDIQSGMCRAYFIRYAYDQALGDCRDFVFGGCGANGNNFETYDECADKCVS